MANRMDLLLINAPIHDYGRYPRYHGSHSPPLGILSIASSVDAAGFEVEVYDAELHQASPAEIVKVVRSRSPMWVGINSFSVNITVVQKIVQLLESGSSRLVLGGPHITNIPDSDILYEFGQAPIYVRGDGESALIQLLKGIDPSQIPNTFNTSKVHTIGASPARFHDLTELPMINRRFSEGEPFLQLNRKWYGLTISRGCMFRCSFCAGSSHSSGMPYRVNPMDRVFNELNYLVRLGATGIRIFDDLPFKGKRPLVGFLTRAWQSFGDSVAWQVNFPLQYVQTLETEDWALLARTNLKTLIFGVEAADVDLRAALGKRIDDERLWKAVHTALEWGIGLKLYFIVGLPGESAESTDRTIALATRLAKLPSLIGTGSVRSSVFAYKPMPGSRLWNDLLQQGYAIQQLLSYADFELSVPEFQKHAWRSALKFSELTPEEISQRIREFYHGIQNPDSDLMELGSRSEGI